MMIVGLAIVPVALVALIIVMIFMTMMLTVAQFMATRGRKMSHFLLLWLLLVLGNLLEKASHLVGNLTLLKKAIILSGLVGTVLFKLANLFWCTLGCTKKICSLFSCAVVTSII